ncbi:amino acid/polyamine transporter I [Phakopsora pachyrhizi]|nr:amino acid/polyamine transporter I [Phakopsora pachyrhizi]
MGGTSSSQSESNFGSFRGPRRHRNRQMSISSTNFNFSTHLLPLGQSLESVKRTAGKIPPSSAIALVVGMQIGSGIFSSPGALSQHSGSTGTSMIIWLVAGLLAWTGANSFAELGAAIPLNGGAQAYLNYSIGGWASYLFMWTSLVALRPGSAAIVSIVGSEYLCRVFYHTAFSASPSQSASSIPMVVIKALAILLLILVISINAFSTRIGNHAPVVLTLLKILSLLGIVVIAILRVASGLQSHNFDSDKIFHGTSHSPVDFALALYSGLWAFDGWDCCNYVAGDLNDAKKSLPLVIHSSMGIVLALFLLANWAYLIVLPLEQVASSNTVALDFGRTIAGPAGGLVFSVVVAISCFGALNSSVFTTSRLISAAAEERYLPKLFSQKHRTRQTPINALILQGVLTIFMIAFGDFKSLVGFYGTCSWTFYLLTVASLLLLRIREPNLERPYKTWLINPITFSFVALFLLIMPIPSAPLQSLAAFGFILAGLPVYYLTISTTENDESSKII